MHSEMDIFHVNLAPRQILQRLHIFRHCWLKRTHNKFTERKMWSWFTFLSFRFLFVLVDGTLANAWFLCRRRGIESPSHIDLTQPSYCRSYYMSHSLETTLISLPSDNFYTITIMCYWMTNFFFFWKRAIVTPFTSHDGTNEFPRTYAHAINVLVIGPCKCMFEQEFQKKKKYQRTWKRWRRYFGEYSQFSLIAFERNNYDCNWHKAQ